MKDTPTISAVITLLPDLERPRIITHGKYCPHIVIGSPNQREPIVQGRTLVENYLGVMFINQECVLNPGQEAEVTMALMYHPEMSYSEVIPGASFTLREGPRIIGFGWVLSRVQQGIQADRPASGGSSAWLRR